MRNHIIQVYIEPACRTSALYIRSLKGLEDAAGQRGLKLRVMTDPAAARELPGESLVVIISASALWTRLALQTLKARGIKSILVGVPPEDFDDPQSGPTLGRRELVRQQVLYFIHAGRRHLASVGNESSDINDMLRRQVFLSTAIAQGLSINDRDVFTGDDGLENCVRRFLDHAESYDGAICVNDLVAVELITQAKARGIRIPEQLFVAGSGNYRIGQIVQPSLTTSTLDYDQMGRLATDIWILLQSNPKIAHMQITLPCELIIRQSTALSAPPQPAEEPRDAMNWDDPKKDDKASSILMDLEAWLMACDALDLRILAGLLDGESINKTAEKVFVSPGTINYRLKKLYSLTGVGNKRLLTQLLIPYLTSQTLLDAADHQHK